MSDEFVFDEKEHAYFLNGKPMLGCTSVLGVIAKPALIQWAANEAVKVTPAVFALLEQAQKISAETGGAFDITIGPLVRCWGFLDGNGQLPDQDSLADARAKVGMHLVQLDACNQTVRFLREGVMLGLGAVGKGYAIDQAAEVLREAGVPNALLHGGTSSIYAIGHPPESDSWMVAIDDPRDPAAPPIASVPLRDESLSVSAVWGRSFSSAGKTYGHVLDPRTGRPTAGALLAAIVLPSGTHADALSTALLTLGPQGIDQICVHHPECRALVVFEKEGRLSCETRGLQTSNSIAH